MKTNIELIDHNTRETLETRWKLEVAVVPAKGDVFETSEGVYLVINRRFILVCPTEMHVRLGVEKLEDR